MNCEVTIIEGGTAELHLLEAMLEVVVELGVVEVPEGMDE